MSEASSNVPNMVFDRKLLLAEALDRPEAAVLKVIGYWFPKAKTERNGYLWIVKSANEFRGDGVDYKIDTIWRAVRRLRKRGVLAVERHFHPYKTMIGPVNFLRPLKGFVEADHETSAHTAEGG